MTKIKMKEWNCNKVFLATEDKKYVNLFKQEFGDSCVVLDNLRADYDPKVQKVLTKYHSDRENDYYLKGKEYLRDMVMLSKCNCFITCRCSGSVGVMLMADHFENVLAFNFGRYDIFDPGFFDQ